MFTLPFNGSELQCKKCRTSFQSINACMDHFSRAHDTIAFTFRCHCMNKEFLSLSLALKHMQEFHPAASPKKLPATPRTKTPSQGSAGKGPVSPLSPPKKTRSVVTQTPKKMFAMSSRSPIVERAAKPNPATSTAAQRQPKAQAHKDKAPRATNARPAPLHRVPVKATQDADVRTSQVPTCSKADGWTVVSNRKQKNKKAPIAQPKTKAMPQPKTVAIAQTKTKAMPLPKTVARPAAFSLPEKRPGNGSSNKAGTNPPAAHQSKNGGKGNKTKPKPKIVAPPVASSAPKRVAGNGSPNKTQSSPPVARESKNGGKGNKSLKARATEVVKPVQEAPKPKNRQGKQPPPQKKNEEGPTEEQKQWMEKFRACDSKDSLDSTHEDFIRRVRERVMAGSASYARRHRPPQVTTIPKNGFNPVSASQLQKLFNENPRKAMREILETPSPQCPVSAENIFAHFHPEEDSTAHNSMEATQTAADDQAVDLLKEAFTQEEVVGVLKKTNNTAPGPDKIRYLHWKKFDEGCYILTTLFNQCRTLGKVPDSWKKSRTVLIHKGGELDDPRNWRPIALIDTVAKLYSSLIAKRLMKWTRTEDKLAPEQKGFMPFEGCLEHNFVLQTVIQDARRNRRSCAMAWLDLTNAFGSVPHDTIWEALFAKGLARSFVEKIREIYTGTSTSYITEAGITPEVVIKKGVKQGCPLSPLIFNFAIDSLVTAASSMKEEHGYWLYNSGVTVLAYADDLVLVGKTKEDLQSLLDVVGTEAQRLGLVFNQKKCASQFIQGKEHKVLDESFSIQGKAMPILQKGQFYRHLGVPTGYRAFSSAEGSVEQLCKDLGLIDASLLAPWQKLSAVNTFLTSRLQFMLKSGFVLKEHLKQWDKEVKRRAKHWANLPKRASNEILYLSPQQGGFGLFPARTLADISTVTQATKFLWNGDGELANVARGVYRSTVLRRTGRDISTDPARFLNGDMEDSLGGNYNDVASLWSRARISTRLLRKALPNLQWVGSPVPAPACGDALTPLKTFEADLKKAVRYSHLQTLIEKPDQGKVVACSSENRVSNHFTWRGQYIRFADWKFIFRARLNCLPLNGALRGKAAKDKRCRRCGYKLETLPHVLCNCNPAMVHITKRHNAVLDRITKGIPLTDDREMRINRKVEGSSSNDRPDIVILDKKDRTATVVDVAVPFENGPNSLVQAREHKISKYEHIRQELEAQGYKTTMGAIIVGALGTWPNENDAVLTALGIGSSYAITLRKLIVADCIKWSRDIYTGHITGQMPARPVEPSGNETGMTEDRAEEASASQETGTTEVRAEEASASQGTQDQIPTPSEDIVEMDTEPCVQNGDGPVLDNASNTDME